MSGDSLTDEERRIFKWPDESVCGYDFCPTLKGGYCIECHELAHATEMAARKRLGIPKPEREVRGDDLYEWKRK